MAGYRDDLIASLRELVEVYQDKITGSTPMTLEDQPSCIRTAMLLLAEESPEIDGDLFLGRCGPPHCDGSHVIVTIGEHGKTALGRHMTDANGARQIAALFCKAAGDIETDGLASKPN